MKSLLGKNKNVHICDVCFNHLEPDGSCLACRLAKRVIELEKGIEKHRETTSQNRWYQDSDRELYKLIEK